MKWPEARCSIAVTNLFVLCRSQVKHNISYRLAHRVLEVNRVNLNFDSCSLQPKTR